MLLLETWLSSNRLKFHPRPKSCLLELLHDKNNVIINIMPGTGLLRLPFLTARH